MRRRLVIVGLALAACGVRHHHRDDEFAYTWSDQRVLCSQGADDYKHPDMRDIVDRQLALARDHGWVALLHAHAPGLTVSTEMLEHVLGQAEADGLATLTYRDLAPGMPHRAGVALSFDDDTPERWFELRDLLARHHAHVTFFACCWTSFSQTQRDDLVQLARDGNDVEPHGAQHVHAVDYAAQHGVAAYITDEVQPSIDAIAHAGMPAPRVYAYPWGEHDDALDAAVLAHVDLVRATRGHCPH